MSLKLWLPLNGDLTNYGENQGVVITNHNAAVATGGIVDKCYSFGSGNSAIQFSESAVKSFTGTFSFSMWIYITGWGNSYDTYLYCGQGSTAWTNYIFGLLRNNTGSGLVFVISNGTGSTNASLSTSNLSLNTWYHVACTFENGKIKIYINGTLNKEYATSIVPNYSLISKCFIGAFNNSGSYQTKSKINDVRIYDHTLSATEVNNLYHLYDVNPYNIHPATKLAVKSGDLKQRIVLNTAGTYADRNIEVTTTTSIPASNVSKSGATVSYTSGWVDAGSQTIANGSFTNNAVLGQSYTENTEANTILPSGGALYINAGYYPNTKITLDHMIPDDANYTNAGVAQIRKNYEAFSITGTKLVGTMADVSPEFSGGALTATAKLDVTVPSITISPSGAFTSASTYGVTQTQPSGTDGTNFLKVDATYQQVSGSATATATASRTAVSYKNAYTGYLNVASGLTASAAPTAQTKTDSNSNLAAVVTDSFAPYYIPIVNTTFSGGTVTATSAYASGQSANVDVEDTDHSGVKVGFSANASRAAIKYTNSAGAIAAHSGADVTGLSSATATTNNASKWIKGFTLNKGKQMEMTNDVTEKVTMKYNSSTNSVDFIFT